MGLEIVSMLLPEGYLPGRKNGQKMVPKGITIHETDNTSDGADALAHGRALLSGNIKGRCWHYTTDEQHAVQHLRYWEEGWHAGDGDGDGNNTTIGVEICVNSNGDYNKAVDNAAKLTALKLKEHKLSISTVEPHKRWSGKNCPQRLLKQWDSFIKKVKAYMTAETSKEIPVKVNYNGKQITEGFARDGVTYVPIRAVAEGMKKKVGWNPKEKVVDIND